MKTITVKGIGKLSAPVDTVELSFRLWQKDKAYDAALRAAASKVSALEAALTDAGFPAADFQTTAFDVNAEYDNVRDEQGGYRSVFSGYVCSYSQRLRFAFDPKRLGEALDAVSASGSAPELRISFTVKEPERLESQLLQAAAANARVRAETLCRASGVRLGELQAIEYDFNHLIFVSDTRMEMTSSPMLAAKRSIAENLRPQDIDLEESAVFIWNLGQAYH